MYISYKNYVEMFTKLLAYFLRHDLINRIRLNKISNQELVKSGLFNNIFNAKEFRKLVINNKGSKHIQLFAHKIIFLRYKTCAWENRNGDKCILYKDTNKRMWQQFKNFMTNKSVKRFRKFTKSKIKFAKPNTFKL